MLPAYFAGESLLDDLFIRSHKVINEYAAIFGGAWTTSVKANQDLVCENIKDDKL